MGITYRQDNDGRLSVQQMDDNFHYLEDQLAGLTFSNSGTSGTSGSSGTSGINGATGPQGATGPADAPKYKVYTALLTQSGTDAPVVTIVSNTLDLNITWVRNNIGQYYAGDITSKCPDAKTVYIISDASNGINLYGVPLKQVHLWTYGDDVPQTGRFLNLSVTTVNNSGDITFADWNSPKVILIEIRVYN